MALEKRNPLPVGRYWVDIVAKYLPDFQDFLRRSGRSIMVMQTKEHADTLGNVAVTSYLFTNTNPLLPWDNTKYGYPNIGTGITDLDQTGQVPAPEPLFSGLGDLTLPLLLLAAAFLLGG